MGICQRCHARDREVGTVGMRRHGDEHWRWLALCGACAELAARSDYVVMFPVPDGGPAAEGDSAHDPAPVPAVPGPRQRAFVARYPGRCSACGEAIAPGDLIISSGGEAPRWQHAACPAVS